MPKLKEILGDAYASLSDEVKNKYKDIDLVDSKGVIEKAKYDQVLTERNDFEKEVGKRDTQLKDLGKLAKDNKDLQDKLETIKTENTTALAQKDAEYKRAILETNVTAALKDSGAKNIDVVKKLLDLDKISYDSDNKTVIGLKDQVEGLKKSDEYLFDIKKGTGSFNTNAAENSLYDKAGGASAGAGGKPEPIGVQLAKAKAQANGGKTAEEAIKAFLN